MKDEDGLSKEHLKDIEIKEEPLDEVPNQGWVFRNLTRQRNIRGTTSSFDPYARNPVFSHADNSAYFELINLTQHFHPSVALFANKILTCKLYLLFVH